MDVVFAYADRMIVLARGRLIAEGEPAVVRDDPQVQEVYFGIGTTFEQPTAVPADGRPHAPSRGQPAGGSALSGATGHA